MEDSQTQISGVNGSDSSGGENGNRLPDGITPKIPGKRGRPKGSKNSGTPLDTGSNAKTRVENNGNTDPTESAKFIGTGFVALVEVIESFLHSGCANKIEKRLPQKLEEFKAMAREISLREKEKETMHDCVSKIAEKHEVMTKFAPEIVLGVMLTQYSLRQLQLVRFVDQVTKRVPDEPTLKDKQPSNETI